MEEEKSNKLDSIQSAPDKKKENQQLSEEPISIETEKSSKKIWIIVLISILVLIVIIGGILIFYNQSSKPKLQSESTLQLKKLCGPKGMGKEYSVLNCNISCEQDSDCKYTCGCGAINKDETCNDGGVIYDCVDTEVLCVNNKCVMGEEITNSIDYLKETEYKPLNDVSRCKSNLENLSTNDKDTCYTINATEKNYARPSLCDKISDITRKNLCYMEIANRIKDSNICDKITDDKIKNGCVIYSEEIYIEDDIVKDIQLSQLDNDISQQINSIENLFIQEGSLSDDILEQQINLLLDKITEKENLINNEEITNTAEYTISNFDNCSNIESYEDKNWYNDLKKSLSERNILLENISDSCFSDEGQILILKKQGSYCNFGNIYRYDINKKILEMAVIMDKETGCLASPNEFGKRENDIIKLIGIWADAGCDSEMYFDYNYISNIVELKKEFGYCLQDKENGTWIEY